MVSFLEAIERESRIVLEGLSRAQVPCSGAIFSGRSGSTPFEAYGSARLTTTAVP